MQKCVLCSFFFLFYKENGYDSSYCLLWLLVSIDHPKTFSQLQIGWQPFQFSVGYVPFFNLYRFRSGSLFFAPKLFNFSFFCCNSFLHWFVVEAALWRIAISLFIAMSRIFFLGWLIGSAVHQPHWSTTTSHPGFIKILWKPCFSSLEQ